jgi:hypothetical protein
LLLALAGCGLDEVDDDVEESVATSELATLESFGYNLAPVRGEIPTLLVHVTYEGHVNAQGQPYVPLYTPSQFRELTFGGRTPNLDGYIRESSSGTAWLRDEGLVEIRLPASELNVKVEERIRRIRALALANRNLDQYDKSLDGRIEDRELLILEHDNDPVSAWGRSQILPCEGFAPNKALMCSRTVVFGGPASGFSYYAHEAMHSFGALDLYGFGEAENAAVSLVATGQRGYQIHRRHR